jgi:hypothetical protein
MDGVGRGQGGASSTPARRHRDNWRTARQTGRRFSPPPEDLGRPSPRPTPRRTLWPSSTCASGISGIIGIIGSAISRSALRANSRHGSFFAPWSGEKSGSKTLGGETSGTGDAAPDVSRDAGRVRAVTAITASGTPIARTRRTGSCRTAREFLRTISPRNSRTGACMACIGQRWATTVLLICVGVHRRPASHWFRQQLECDERSIVILKEMSSTDEAPPSGRWISP